MPGATTVIAEAVVGLGFRAWAAHKAANAEEVAGLSADQVAAYKAAAGKAFGLFGETFRAKYPAASLTMVFKLALSAQKRWRSLNGANLLADVIAGVVFVDGKKRDAT